MEARLLCKTFLAEAGDDVWRYTITGKRAETREACEPFRDSIVWIAFSRSRRHRVHKQASLGGVDDVLHT